MPAKKTTPSQQATDAIANYLLDSKKIKLNTKSKARIQELITDRFKHEQLQRFLVEHIYTLIQRFVLPDEDIGPSIVKTDVISYFYFLKQVYPSFGNGEIKILLKQLQEEIPDDEGDE